MIQPPYYAEVCWEKVGTVRSLQAVRVSRIVPDYARLITGPKYIPWWEADKTVLRLENRRCGSRV